MEVEKKGEKEEGKEEKATSPSLFPLHGDLLVEVLRHLPTVDLVPALYVSTAWQQAVRTSLRRAPRSKPWLFVQAQSRRRPSAVATHAYDPHSHVWLRVPTTLLPQPPLSSSLRSSPSCGLLYELTPSRLAVRSAALGAPWQDLGAPGAWRADPVVAAAGDHVLVAGGTNYGLLGDDPCAVELHSRADGTVTPCEPMPGAFRASASATFLSVAASHSKVYVLERSTGLLSALDVETGRWGSPTVLRPDSFLFSSAIAFSGGCLVLAGLGLDGECAVGLRLWTVDCVTLQCGVLGAMPAGMLERLAGGDGLSLSSVDIAVVGEFGYIWRPSDPAVVVSCDFAGGVCRWGEVRAPAGVAESPAERYVVGCVKVGMEDLRRVFWPGVGPAGRSRVGSVLVGK